MNPLIVSRTRPPRVQSSKADDRVNLGAVGRKSGSWSLPHESYTLGCDTASQMRGRVSHMRDGSFGRKEKTDRKPLRRLNRDGMVFARCLVGGVPRCYGTIPPLSGYGSSGWSSCAGKRLRGQFGSKLVSRGLVCRRAAPIGGSGRDPGPSMSRGRAAKVASFGPTPGFGAGLFFVTRRMTWLCIYGLNSGQIGFWHQVSTAHFNPSLEDAVAGSRSGVAVG